MSIDCSNILNYKQELSRLHNYYHTDGRGCKGCPFEPRSHSWSCADLFDINFITQTFIDTVQKWSDENQLETRKGKFKRLCETNGFEDVFNYLIEQGCEYLFCIKGDCKDCMKYWNEPIGDKK